MNDTSLCKNGPLASLTDLIDLLLGASILAATASDKPCSSIAEPCMEIQICQISVRDLIEWLSTGWSDWAGSVGFGWTWPLDPKTKACWATPEQLG